MFTITQSKTYKFPVTISSPSETTKDRQDASFTGIFKRHTVSELSELTDSETDPKAIVRKILVGWEGVKEDFSKENLEIAMENIGFNNAVITAFMASVTDAPRKN